MKPKLNRTLIAILFLSVVARVAVALYLGDIVDNPPLLTDQRSYHALGERLITGHGFSFDRGWYPFTQPEAPTAHWSFLYSFFIAAVYTIFGPHPLAARLVQAILGGILLPLMVYLFAKRVYRASPLNPAASQLSKYGLNDERLALISAGLAAVYFYFILYAATLMTETFYISGLLWLLINALNLAETPSLKHGLLLGISLSVTTLLRQSILPWAAVLIVWLVWTGWQRKTLGRTIRSGVVAIAVLVLSIAPFTIRNYAAFGQFLLLNSNAGYAMFSAQHPMHGTEFREFDAAPVPPELVGLNEAQLDKELMARGIGFVLAEPGRYLALSMSRVVDYFEFWPTPDTSLLNNVGRVGSIGVLLPFILIGLWLAFRHGGIRSAGGWRAFSQSPLALISLFMLVYSVLHVFTWAMPRYRLPVDAVALPLAALAMASVINRWRARKTA
ncbi:MAG: glycosyltransferase family 39 protein [Thermoflexales bacterium]|nr:glycosyltransferase family 39 protein [Thermoflexales bacterium]